MTIIQYAVEDGVAILTWDDAARSMNVVSGQALEELEAGVSKAVADDAVKGIVLTSGKPGIFVAGGDLEQIAQLGSGPIDAKDMFEKTSAVLDQLRRMETCGKPIVAALNGVTLGGGLEIALACHRRIAVDSRHVKIGLPEAAMGLMPGAGGTQRLPRLVGITDGVALILQGRQLTPEQALKKGVIDQAVAASDLLKEAKRWILEVGNAVQPWDQKGYEVPGGGVDSPAGAQVLMGSVAMVHANTYGNIPATQAILSAIYEGLKLPMDRAAHAETRAFISVLRDPTALNMLRTLFFSLQEAEKGVRRPKEYDKLEVKKLGILGAGLMGAGIAHDAAKVGIEVVLLDVSDDLAAAGKGRVERLLQKKLQKGRTTQEKVDALLGLIHPTTDYAKLNGCQLVVEAVKEDRQIKDIVIKAADAQLDDDAVFATNTSGLPITELAESSSRPERFIGLHFFSPVDKMKMVEVVMGKKTSQKALAHAWDFLLKIRKAAIVVNDSPDFYTSRVIGTFVTEMGIALAEGVKPALVEHAAKMAGMPMAPMVVCDMMGLGTMHAVAARKKADCEARGEVYQAGPTQRVVELLVEKHERFGQTPPPKADGTPRKPGGFYDYDETGDKRLWPELDAALKTIASNPIPTTPDDMVRRYLFTQCLEAARCFEEGVISSVPEADVGVVMSVGFPAYTGGPCSYMDTFGIGDFVAEADRLAQAYGSRFEPPKLLRDMAAEGRSWY